MNLLVAISLYTFFTQASESTLNFFFFFLLWLKLAVLLL
jgi:hypothetical protein